VLKQYIKAIEDNNIVSKTDIYGIITFVNDEFCKISGYSKKELIGQNHNIVRHPDVEKNKFKLLWDTIKAKNTYKDTVKNLSKNGKTFYVNTTVIPILDEKNNIVEFIAIRYDVTKEFEYKKEMQEKQRVMFWQSRLASQGQMLANIAHQWRQPLTELNLALYGIKKSAQNNKSTDLDKFYDESKKIIQNMSLTIEDFSNFFEPQKEKHSFCIKKSVNESIKLLQKIISKEMISIQTDFESVQVIGVSNELTQVIINLIKNSIEAFVKNSILIREIFISIKKVNNFVIVEVSDNAGGISKINLEKIFEPYFTSKFNSTGTGLGLFMSKMICEQGLNGSLNVKSKKNTSTFTIKLAINEK